MSFKDTRAIAKQLAFEMNIPSAAILMRPLRHGYGELRRSASYARGVYGTVLDWQLLQPSSSSASATEVMIPKPDPGARPTHRRGTATESTDRETRLQDIWCGVQSGPRSCYCYVGRENQGHNLETLRDGFPAMAVMAAGI